MVIIIENDIYKPYTSFIISLGFPKRSDRISNPEHSITWLTVSTATPWRSYIVIKYYYKNNNFVNPRAGTEKLRHSVFNGANISKAFPSL